jgi:hypothetical protein
MGTPLKANFPPCSKISDYRKSVLLCSREVEVYQSNKCEKAEAYMNGLPYGISFRRQVSNLACKCQTWEKMAHRAVVYQSNI